MRTHRKPTPTDGRSPAIDVGAKPTPTEQPDTNLERELARQAAVNDAGRGVFDVPGVLASDQPIQYEDRTVSWVAHEQEQARLRAELDTHAAEGLRHLIEVGRDDSALERGAGLTAWRARLEDAEADEAEASKVVEDAERDLANRSAARPASHRTGALIATWFSEYGLSLAAIPAEFFVIAVALELATASEDRWEKWGLSAIVLFGLVSLPHLIARGLRRIRYEGDGGWTWVLTGAASTVLLALILGIGMLRNLAAQVNLSTGTSDATSAVQRTDAAATTASTAVETTSPDLYWVFVVIMLVLSIAVLLHGFLSHAPEQMAFIRARRALDRARATSSTMAQVVTEIESRLAYQAEDIEKTKASAEQYATSVLPALGDELVEIYTQQLIREVGDPQFTDAVRAVTAARAESRMSAQPLEEYPADSVTVREVEGSEL